MVLGYGLEVLELQLTPEIRLAQALLILKETGSTPQQRNLRQQATYELSGPNPVSRQSQAKIHHV